MIPLSEELLQVRERYLSYIKASEASQGQYRFSPGSETSPFARCFAIFGMHTAGLTQYLLDRSAEMSELIVKDFLAYYSTHAEESKRILAREKHILQLLTFSLSALAILEKLEQPSLEPIIRRFLWKDVSFELERVGALTGRPGSGNLAMFGAILLIHARDYWHEPIQNKIDEWVERHIEGMDSFGFWSESNRPSYHSFQHGYHQYEIFRYLDVDHPKKEVAAETVARFADARGHFAPVPGGGGCFDYDAVFLLTDPSLRPSEERSRILERTRKSIISEQNSDGGFCESIYAYRSFREKISFVLGSPQLGIFEERLRANLRLLRARHARIQTHWTKHSRRWNESNLWDSWFRYLTLATLEGQKPNIPYPGIAGFNQTRVSLNPSRN